MSQLVSDVRGGRNGKTALLIEQLRSDIARGARLPGEKLPSFAEMRRNHGVAAATIDRIYAELERDGLVRRENGKGVFVREQRSRARTGTIGFSVQPPFTESGKRSGYFGPLVEAVQAAALQHGYEVLLLKPGSHVSWEKVDGVLISQGYSPEIYSHFPPGMPFVSMIMEWVGQPSIVSEDEGGMRNLTQHLLDLGHRRIALISGGETRHSLDRLRGFHEACFAAKVTPAPEWQRDLAMELGFRDFETLGYQRMRQWLDEDWSRLGFTALMAYNDDVAYGAIRALEEAAYSVPRDVSVTGFDGIATAENQPQLTTCALQMRQIANLAVAGLRDWIESDVRPQSATVEARFVAGLTTGICQRES